MKDHTVSVVTTKRHFVGAGTFFLMQPNEADIYHRRGMVEYVTGNMAPAGSRAPAAGDYVIKRGPGRPRKNAA